MTRRYAAEKTFDDLSCAYRHWRSGRRLGSIHGYALSITLRMSVDPGSPPHEAGVVDFSKFGPIKTLLADQFDHALLVAEDDPELGTLVDFADRTGTRLRVLPSVALDGIAEWVTESVTPPLKQLFGGRLALREVEIAESLKNRLTYLVGIHP